MKTILNLIHAKKQETDIHDFLRWMNQRITKRLTYLERQQLARCPQLVNHIAESTKNAKPFAQTIISESNNFTASSITGLKEYGKGVEKLLKKLEKLQSETILRHGKLTPEFYQQRALIRQEIGTKSLRMVRRLMTGTSTKLTGKQALGIKNRSQQIHWKKNGNDGKLKDLKPLYSGLERGAKYMKLGGYVTTAVEVGVAANKVAEACSAEDDSQCAKTAFVETGGVVGSIGGAWVGAKAGAALCLPAVPTGAGYLACVVGFSFAGAYAGSKFFSEKGKSIGESVYNATRNTSSQNTDQNDDMHKFFQRY